MAYQRPQPVRAGTVPRIPKGVYKVLVREATPETSKTSGNPMVVIKIEVVSPETVQFNGHTVKVVGAKATMYASFSEKAIGGTITFLDAMRVKLPPPAETMEQDIANMQEAAKELTGTLFQMNLSSSAEEMKDSLGNPLLDNDGKPIMGQEQVDAAIFNVLPNTRTTLDGTPIA